MPDDCIEIIQLWLPLKQLFDARGLSNELCGISGSTRTNANRKVRAGGPLH